MAEVILDLGEWGIILVESPDQHLLSSGDDATEKTGFVDTIRQTGGQIQAGAADLLKLPLTGLAKLLLASLPEPSANEPYELDAFSVEFNLGIKAEKGVNAGAVAKIMPEGAFKCTYTWKRKPKPPGV
ncbi:MAG TPA: hypothetical protein IGS52_12245 [Oscillatoriaceae cyanobacterium M33_DOE_052]|uniref:Uncharacterized protein n=1 Tax=Planktothricoides sp. SpSt-374 TaxID=2282167 RepID=A0A7C3VSC2_9CYAN|nr:hypothetical protein [Oscillatoriaceae cyanobacterium M33_DOE_052]